MTITDLAPTFAASQDAQELRAEVARLRWENDGLQVAIDSNRRIGIALGILMAIRGLSQQQAFDLLRRTSQRHQRKLRVVADDVIFTGTLPLPADDKRPPQ